MVFPAVRSPLRVAGYAGALALATLLCACGHPAVAVDAAVPDLRAGDAGGDAGAPPDDLVMAMDAGPTDGPPPVPPAIFEDWTAKLGLPKGAFQCAVFRDLDGDSRPDIVLAPADDNGQFAGAIQVYRNAGGAALEPPRKLTVPMNEVHYCSAGDFDNDGFADLVVAGILYDGNTLRSRVVLLHNDGKLGFSDMTGDINAAMPSGGWIPPDGVTVLDADRDGRLDVFVAFNADYNGLVDITCVDDADVYQCRTHPAILGPFPLLLHNDGGARFSARPSGITWTEGFANAANLVDIDDDGISDVFISIDFGRSVVARGRGDGTFEDVWPRVSPAPYNHGMGVAQADFDRNGRDDCYTALIGADGVWVAGDGGVLDDRTHAWGVADVTRLHSGWSPHAVDLDLDGYEDVFVANSVIAFDQAELLDQVTNIHHMPYVPRAQQGAFVFKNRGAVGGVGFQGQLVPYLKLSPLIGFASVAVADFDGDGRSDVLEVVTGQSFVARLLHNVTPVAGRHWLTVKLAGTTSNREGFGARVVLVDGGLPWQRRLIHGGSRGASEPVAHFGLGATASVESLEVRWPTGKVQRVAGPIAADRVLVVTEP
nr:hypothetical protein Hi04_10k_c2877_00012 [uncultured bacterium]